MASFLILYGTSEGQTAKVATCLADTLKARGHAATTRDISEAGEEIDLAAFDAALVGSSIHVGQQHADIQAFVKTHREALRERPTAFFQLSLNIADPREEKRAEAAQYMDAFLEETGWHPDRIGHFGGALRYSKYGFLKRLMMKQIAKRATGDIDTSRDYEYTDWAEVDAFANDVAAFVEGRLGAVPDEAPSR